MIPNLPAYVSITFGLTVLATLLLFYRAVSQSDSLATRQKATFVNLLKEGNEEDTIAQ